MNKANRTIKGIDAFEILGFAGVSDTSRRRRAGQRPSRRCLRAIWSVNGATRGA